MNPKTNNERLNVPTPLEFDFDECLVFLNRSGQENLHRIDGNRITKLLRYKEELILIGITHQEQHLHIDFLNGTPSEEGQRSAADYVWEWFDLKTDLVPFYEMAAGDPILQRIVKRHFGLRVLGFPDLFEAMAWAITGQQINLTFAYTLKKRFVEAYGKSIVYKGKEYWTFPLCSEIAGLAVSDLTPMQYSGRKAEYIIGIATQMAEEKLVKDDLTNGKDAQTIEKELVAIRGVGPWSANYVMMKCLGITSAFPLADVGLHNALKYQLELEKKPTIAEIERFAENWKGWEAYATFYLWRSLYE